ncbi:MAG: hypothetical protein AABM67_16255 [Acidobacteriota bacterium]
MGVNEDPISGILSGTNYGENRDRFLEKGTYDYSLKVTDSGKLAFKVEVSEDGKSRWLTIEDKSKVSGGNTLVGTFVVASNGSFNRSPSQGEGMEVRFNFNREFLSHKVGYELSFERRVGIPSPPNHGTV